ncbi:restriction endonuclease subunit S [Mycoplasmopsis gallinacea]|uniref:Type I restriction enzyme specificity protein n=1 Tax=Mycoplasmopsis gallinacea TaxID=29556 RepID=A0A449A3T3_9BACT|nr:restriction endonuclease subunit S [Mycoplasmopsis gallinacea]VEU58907.1 Type I restriction enzyme specificity protein [Mycoplasmopsis gallinacea]
MKLFEELLKNNKVITFKKLSEIAKIVRGNRITKKDLAINGFPVKSGGIGVLGYYHSYNRKGEQLTIAQYGTAGLVQWQENNFWANDVCLTIESSPEILNKYIYYFLLSKQKDIFKSNIKATPEKINITFLNNLLIPIVDLETQIEIINILNKFTEYSAELKAELKARDEQYKFYRDKLLSDNNLSNDASISGIKSNIAKVKDYIDYIQPTKFIVKSDKYNPEFKTPVLTANQKFILGYTDEKQNIFHSSKENPVIIFDDFTTDLKWVDFDFKIKSSAIKILTPKNSNINIKYFYYWLNFIHNTEESSKEHKRHWISVFAEKLFTLPVLSVQNKIVKVLDNFESILKDLNIGLPAEEAKRQQQYEYYRDAIFKYLETGIIDNKGIGERERERAD